MAGVKHAARHGVVERGVQLAGGKLRRPDVPEHQEQDDDHGDHAHHTDYADYSDHTDQACQARQTDEMLTVELTVLGRGPVIRAEASAADHAANEELGPERLTPPRCDRLLDALAQSQWPRLVELGRELLPYVGVETVVPDTLTDLGGGACFNDARVQVEKVVST